MSALAEKLPTLSVADLKSLRANAERVAERDAGVQSATAAEIIPLIDLEFERRAALPSAAPKKRTPVRKKVIPASGHQTALKST